jgi:thymidine kinase
MIEVIAGCMFSGKSEELNRRLRRAEIARQSIAAYKPSNDDRYHSEKIASHANSTFSAKTFKDFDHLVNLIMLDKKEKDIFPDIIAIDEVQFLPQDIVPFVEMLAYSGVRVILSGLDMDYQGRPFGPMPNLLSIADKVDKITAICIATDKNGFFCGKPATRSFRVPSQDTGSLVQIGAADSYQARCRECWKRDQK